ncbi:headcase protein homolog [Gadus chalcogrammus]|uniref:headcase protein homolog n=1 Tax=Gadus chalcogrammus TaxID=1042646 RepID=UPI0024C4C63E|nr:headcase protein homolog [Gadus chalcogrammus]
MPNQKNIKGKKSKRTNSSGDEQENGASATATGGAATAALVGATAAPRSGRTSEAPCATPLICSLARPIDLDKDDYQRVLCNSELCPYGNWMHLQCFYEWESSILIQFNCIGRARSWNEKQCRQNMWTKKGYDLAFRFCSCRCGQGHLRKDTDWYQVKRTQDDRKKKPTERSSSRAGPGALLGACGGAAGGGAAGWDGLALDEVKKSKVSPGGGVGGGKLIQRASSQELPRRQSLERQNSSERGATGGGGGGGGLGYPGHHHNPGGTFPFGALQKSPCGSPGQSPTAGFPFFSPGGSAASPFGAGVGGGGPATRGSRHLGEFFKSAVLMERKHLLSGAGGGGVCGGGGGAISRSGGMGASHLDAGGTVLPLAFALPLPHRLAHDAGHPHHSHHHQHLHLNHHHPVQFLRRLDLSELFAHVPRHKLNTYHVRMEDDTQAGQGEELRRFILSALSASQRNVVNCALCHRALPVFEQFPLVDGTLFLSPSRHDEIEYDVPCHLQGRLMHLYAICVDCLEGVHKIVCIKCKSRWDGSWHQLGTMYTYDILAATPCCQARLNCKHCGKPVVDVRVGMQYFSEYSNVQQCPHCGNLDYHFVKPFSSFKVLEAY